MYRQKHRQLGSGSASTQRERENGERQKCAIFLGEREVRWQCTFRCVCVCVCANKCRFFSFLKKYFEQIKFCFVPREFLYYLTSAIRFTKLGQISARIPLSLSFSFAHSLCLSCALESRILRGAGAWDLGVITVFALLNCFVPQFQLVTHTSSSKKATLRWRWLRLRRQLRRDAEGLRCHLLKIRPNAAAALLQINELTFWQVQTIWEKITKRIN